MPTTAHLDHVINAARGVKPIDYRVQRNQQQNAAILRARTYGFHERNKPTLNPTHLLLAVLACVIVIAAVTWN